MLPLPANPQGGNFVFGVAEAINNLTEREAVGNTILDPHALRWEKPLGQPWTTATAIVLDNHLRAACGWELGFANDLNEISQIVGEGRVDLGSGDVTRAYLLTPVTCPADLTGDGTVDVFDLLELLGSWGLCPSDCSTCRADLIGAGPTPDGTVNVFDLLELLTQWGDCSNPVGNVPESVQDCYDEYGDAPEKLEACLEWVLLSDNYLGEE